MKTSNNFVFAVSFLLTVVPLTSCSNLFPRPIEKTLFMLEVPTCESIINQNGPSLLVSDIESSAFLDSTRIVFSDLQNTRSADKLATWVEPPPRVLQKSVIKSLRCEGIFHGVEERSSMVRTDYQLSIHLNDFVYDASDSPSVAKLAASAELIDLKTRKLVSQKDFDIEERATDVGITNAVDAFQRVSQTFLKAIGNWVRENVLISAVK